MLISPAHPKVSLHLQRGIFDGLTNFRELEGRITALATKGERGEAFEVFAEAYLSTVAVEKAKQVWPGARVPHSLRKRLALTIVDKGVDGVFETPLGEHHAYQAKFRTGRPSLTWDELSTFIGLADRVDQRVLITNCDRFADVVKQRTGFYAITGNDLDKLEPRDFAAIRAWLEGARVERQPKTPLSHQAEAIDSILSALRDHDRATALMACGTGKTLVALWVAERMDVRNILVLVPSLALLRQTLHEWARETPWCSFVHLCVCSDPTVKPDSDEIILRSSDLDFPVTTDGAHVREFLTTSFDGVKLVFSTYQSAHVVAAGMKQGNAFDLAIFDEAHKTAGREGVHFSFALNDQHLPIRKRLFLTATPRHYDIRRRDKEGDARLVYSMDAPEIYGPVAHKLTFAEAARRDIICNYKVIISIVTSEMINEHLLRHGEVIVKGDTVKARHVANQLALQAAVEKHGVSKIFTFHRSVASAAAFTSNGSQGIGNHLSGFDAYHVNGAMPMSERKDIMIEFDAAPKAVISNAKCLTEGVNVPAVDMVAFLTPKRSRVDIVQATGRAMRKALGKTTGYVLVPLFVEQSKGETIEEALARTEFDEVWNVLQAMQEQDDLLAEIIREMREERGRTGGFDDSRFREKIQLLSPQISLEALRRSITTACVDVLGDKWEERYVELKAFKERFGHCKVLRSKHSKLGKWVSLQRVRKKKSKLPIEQIKRLDALGFVWDPLSVAWEKYFDALVMFRNHHGHCRVPQNSKAHAGLGQWVSNQRQAAKEGKLSTAQLKRLDGIGFIWNSVEEVWEKRFRALLNYKKQYGNCDVPLNFVDHQLAKWVRVQRSVKASEKLREGRIQRLNEVGFNCGVYSSHWETMYRRLAEYKQRTGHCEVPKRRSSDPKLGRWVILQRKRKKTGVMSREEGYRLEAIGFRWNPADSAWEEMYKQLLEYKQRHGTCNVPTAKSKLGGWVSNQRMYKRNGELDSKRLQRLDSIGFIWDRFEARWEEGFRALVQYRDKYGNFEVPRDLPKESRLSQWVRTQRTLKNSGGLAQTRIERLGAIGFTWRPAEAEWKEMFSELLKFKHKVGHCRVPLRKPDNPKLGHWVTAQRRHRQILSESQVNLLNEVGFAWDANEDLWEEMFQAFDNEKRKHANSAVSLERFEHPSLRGWILQQRQLYKFGKLRQDRLTRLNQIGFGWNPHKSKWDEMFAQLEQYKAKIGHCKVPYSYLENRKLARWVNKQRAKRGKLSKDRIRRLNEIGFWRNTGKSC